MLKPITANGKCNQAIIYTENVEEKALSQIIELCNQEFIKGSKIRIMPDTHAGAGCVIGTTMTIQDKVVPNLVGVDIGCGMECIRIHEKDIDLAMLDSAVHSYIPAGFDIRNESHTYSERINLNELRCKGHVNLNRAILSIGTLGGGNHFIEVDKDNDGFLYLVVHSGSRNLGKQAAEYYQDVAYKEITNNKQEIQALVEQLKAAGREQDIQAELKKSKAAKVKKELAYLENDSFNDYIHDMKIIQQYAVLNRCAIVNEIVTLFGWHIEEQFTTIHNYIDTESMILRKGAISAQKGEKVLIPMNMRDGSLICLGKGNSEWNYSAPHGAGRLMSRSKAKEIISLGEFKDSMNDIYSTTVNQSTIDEAPMAYKPMDEIIENIKDTVDVLKIIKPIYNFKASE
jgi:tRNA-splicing ligase RtcB (3'-phosphate/5'-hydroxy nucleic acid ligase)